MKIKLNPELRSQPEFLKATILVAEKKFKEALKLFQILEARTKNGRCPDASLNKGYCHIELNEFEEALKCFEKAERNSPNGINPDATIGIGNCLLRQNEYEKAINAFEKAEKLSADGKCSEARNGIGECLFQKNKINDAILAFEKAEADGKNGKFITASENKGYCYMKLEEFEMAVEAFSKAERDEGNGKNISASFYRGICLVKLEKYEEAFSAFEKTELDSSNGKNPRASFNKGLCLHILKKNEKAVIAFEKAENDSPDGKLPEASFGKGNALYDLWRFEDAIMSFEKAISDSSNNYFPKAHLQLSRIHYRTNYERSEYHGFVAMKQDNLNYGITVWIYENLCNVDTKVIYQNRCNYINALFIYEFGRVIEENIEERYNELIKLRPINNESDDLLFTFLLKQEEFHLKLDFDYKAQIRYAYLIHFANNRPEETYCLLDFYLEDKIGNLDGIDYFFYLFSAFLIGEPISTLGMIWKGEVAINDPFYEIFTQLSKFLKSKLDGKHFQDPYLLNFQENEWNQFLSKIPAANFHSLINSVLEVIRNRCVYSIPFSHEQVKGFLLTFLSNSSNIAKYDEYISIESKNRFQNFKNSILIKDNELLLFNIREYIKYDGEFALQKVIFLLAEYQIRADDIEEQKRLSTLQTCSCLSFYIDYKNGRLKIKEFMKLAVEGGIVETLSLLVFSGMTGSGSSISMFIYLLKSYKKMKDRKMIEEKFTELLKSIE